MGNLPKADSVSDQYGEARFPHTEMKRSATHPSLPLLALFGLSSFAAQALTFKVDYSYDTAGFFNDPARREAFEEVTALFGDLIQDELTAIDDATFAANTLFTNTWNFRVTNPVTGANLDTVTDLRLEKDEVIIYAFGTPFSDGSAGRAALLNFGAVGDQPFLDAVQGRGKAGATGEYLQQREVALRTAAVVFDTNTTWNFDNRSNGPGQEFYAIAIHEMMHVLGMGTTGAFDRQVVNGTFNGTNAVRVMGKALPLNGDGDHWLENNFCSQTTTIAPNNPNQPISSKLGVFGQEHGAQQLSVMDPTVCDSPGQFHVLTELDIAVLQDLGWTVRHPLATEVNTAADGTLDNLEIQTLGSFNYVLERSTDLSSFSPIRTVAGTGEVQNVDIPAPVARSAFFRVRQAEAVATTRARTVARSKTKSDGKIRTLSVPDRGAVCGGCHGH